MPDHKLTTDDYKLLAKQQQQMDSGEVPFVMLKGTRIAVMPDVMTDLKLTQGQAICDGIFTRILEMSLRKAQAELAAKELERDNE